MQYAAAYPEEVVCLVAIDAVPRPEASSDKIFKTYGHRIDSSLKFHHIPARNFEIDLTFEKALEV
jgi:hypothetical protein